MDRIINQFSFIIGAVVILGLAVALLLRRGFSLGKGLLLGALLLLLLAAWIVLHPAGDRTASAQQIRDQIGAGKPVLLEFLSPY
ncbi:MAG TPA: hypothetical protein VN364_02680 [Bellilinea sp.]|nr:hypothetical protein [Bellilinea sp.]